MFVRSLSLGVAAAALMVGGAQAADLIIPTTPQPIYAPAGFNWEGLYAGVQGGGEFFNGTTYGVIGGHVGVNFIPADPILLGVEATGEYWWNNAVSGSEFLINARIGAVVTDSVLVYAIGGTGIENTGGNSQGIYQLGGGVEFAVTDSISVRGQVVGLGYYNNANFFDATKATVGVSFHF